MKRAAFVVLLVACGGRISDPEGTGGNAGAASFVAGAAGAPKLCEDIHGVPYECPPEFRDPAKFNLDEEAKARGGSSGQ